jgi:hypothetical protein
MDPIKNSDPTPEKPEEGKTEFMKSSEAKMILYVVPVALILVLIAWAASSCGA